MAFPVVPRVPGVPALPRAPGAIAAGVELLTRDLVSGFLGSIAPRWGIFRDGFPVVVSDNVATFDYKQDWSVSDYPLEKGAFESYDKVQIPFSTRLRFSAGRSEAYRAAFLASIEAIAGTLDLYDAVTPERIYTSVNVTHYDYRRTSQNGVGLLIIDVWLIQVRVTASAAFSSTKSPSAAAAKDGGVVPTRPPTPAESAKVADSGGVLDGGGAGW